ncbi:hypothetical protein AALA24_09930 [Anaerovoracaceae bacterium 42-11]
MRIAAVILFAFGVLFLIFAIAYGRKQNIRKIMQEYKVITEGLQTEVRNQMNQEGLAKRKAAETVYRSQIKKEAEYEPEKTTLSEKERESLRRAEERAEKQREEFAMSYLGKEAEKFSQVKIPKEPENEDTQLLDEEETMLLGETGAEDWNQETGLLDIDETQLLKQEKGGER